MLFHVTWLCDIVYVSKLCAQGLKFVSDKLFFRPRSFRSDDTGYSSTLWKFQYYIVDQPSFACSIWRNKFCYFVSWIINDDFGNIPWQQWMLISMFEYQIMHMKQFWAFWVVLIHPSLIHGTSHRSQDIISYWFLW